MRLGIALTTSPKDGLGCLPFPWYVAVLDEISPLRSKPLNERNGLFSTVTPARYRTASTALATQRYGQASCRPESFRTVPRHRWYGRAHFRTGHDLRSE